MRTRGNASAHPVCRYYQHNNDNDNDKTMRQYKESEWREEVEAIGWKDYDPEPLKLSHTSDNISRATTRGAVLHFYFSLPENYQADRTYILDARRRLRAISKERRKRVITKIRQWRKSITTRIYRWQLKREYKRIIKHDKTK